MLYFYLCSSSQAIRNFPLPYGASALPPSLWDVLPLLPAGPTPATGGNGRGRRGVSEAPPGVV